jgi:hypothetical protein
MVKSTNFRNYKINGSIDIKTVTWIKDSHGLFDYESNQVIIKK